MKRMTLRENFSRSMEVLGAYGRQGAKELGAAFYGPGTVAQSPEYGMIATKTPGEVADGMRAKDTPDASRNDPAPSMIDAHIERAAAERSEHVREPERDDRGPERE